MERESQQRSARNRFTGRAAVYSRFRPSYPKKYIDYLIVANSLVPGSTVADSGSGTGILSRQLLDRSLKVFAVEPNSDMRQTAERELVCYPSFISIDATAEDTTLDRESIDLVTAAQAFHWFDREKFKAECRRVLKEGAKVALVWNSRDYTSSLVQENENICKKYCADFVAFSHGIESKPEVFSEFYKDGKYKIMAFRNDVHYDLESYIGRNLSGSYATNESGRNYQPFVQELANVFEKYSQDGIMTMPGITRSYLGSV